METPSPSLRGHAPRATTRLQELCTSFVLLVYSIVLRVEHGFLRLTRRAVLVLRLRRCCCLRSGATAASAAARAAAAAPEPANPNTLGRGSGDAVRSCAGSHRAPTSSTCRTRAASASCDQFCAWTPPIGMTAYRGHESSEGGKCSLTGGNFECNGNIRPPACTCLAGGELTVNFTATGLQPTFSPTDTLDHTTGSWGRLTRSPR